MTANRPIKSVNDPAAAVKRAAAFLLPPHPKGIAQDEAAMQAHGLVEAAIALCVRAGRDDLAFRLQEIGFDLRGLPAREAVAAPDAEPSAPKKPRRKLPQAAQGKRERAKLAKAGAVHLGAG